MTLKRRLPTLLAFPLGRLLAIEIAGSLDDRLSAAAGGLTAGTAIGAPGATTGAARPTAALSARA